ncbi:MAG TPA: SgcJ/EcaC family oxidoreductase [Pyrinomonadaceae bacterium]|nr:SgcJ/EcaC family oxidoreductase [Pyrinomonadaceae bacterium]
MSKRINLFGLALAAVVLAFAQAGDAQTSPGASANANANSDEAAVRQIVKQLEDGWNAHDARAFAAPFAADADYVVVNGAHIKGREAIEQGHVGIFTTLYKESRNVATVKSVRFLRPRVREALRTLRA